MADNSTKIIIIGVAYLMIFSVCMAYFIENSGQDVPGYKTFPYCPTQDPRCHTLTNGSDYTLLNTSTPIDLITEGYIGDWDVDENGITSTGSGDNWVFLTPAYDSVNATYLQKLTVYNPSNREFDVVIGFAWAPIPYIYNPDVTLLKIETNDIKLVQAGGLALLPWETVLDSVSYTAANEIGNYTITTTYATEGTPYRYRVTGLIDEIGELLTGEEDVIRSIQYAGGVHVVGANLSVQSNYYQQSHYMAEGTEDWAGMIRAVFAVIFWQVPTSVMPTEILFIFIIVPETGIAIAIASRMWPL